MNHITQEAARELAEKSGFFFQDVGYSPTFHTMPLEYSQKCFERLCNAAIEWYIAQQAASVDATFKKWNSVQDRNAAVLDLYKNSPEMNTSQERVQKSEEIKQVPLTDEQIEDGRKAIFSTDNPYCPCDSKTMRKAVQWAERKHGIGVKV